MRKKNLLQEWLPYILLGIGCLFMAGRAFYGLDLSDESFYLAAAKRFASGDRPFREEWFTTQLIGVLLCPLYSLYTWVCGGQDGVILFLRLCYVVFSGGIAVYLFRILDDREEIGKKAALCAAFLYLFYVRANIPTLSYYSIGLGTFLLCLLMKQRDSIFQRCGAGVSFAISVVCMPYMVIYFLFILIWDVCQIARRNRKCKEMIPFYLGIMISAAVFLTFLFSGGDVDDIIVNLPYILQDPEHQGTIWGSIAGFMTFMSQTFYRFLFWPMVIEFLAIIIWSARGRVSGRVQRALRWMAYLLFLLQAVYLRTFFEGGIVIAFLLLAIQLAMLCGQWEPALAKKYLVSGILFGIIWIIGSNVGQRVFNMGCIVADIWAMKIVWNDIESSSGMERRLKCLAPVLVLLVLFAIRMFDIYRDSSIQYLTETIEEGSGKGIRTTPERKKEYMDMRKQLERYDPEEKSLVVSGIHPWIYLESVADCGSLAVWNLDFSDERSRIYYERYPEKIPDVIFIINPEYEQYQAWRYSSHGSYDGNNPEDVLEGCFLELVEEQNYRMVEEECGVFYVQN